MNEGGAENGEPHARRTAELVARRSYGRLVALLATYTRDLSAAEDALADAFARALEHWPNSGCPSNPEAWLLAAARRRVIDMIRRRRTAETASPELRLLEEEIAAEVSTAGAPFPDQRLALMFACAHPSIDVSVRAPLMLQTVLGLDAKRIASAFLTSPGTMGQRLWRAKEKIRQAGIPFRIPDQDALPGRLDAVLDAVYAAFAEGWSDSEGTDVARRELAEEATFLARLVVELAPAVPEALGLLALLLPRRGAPRSEARRAR